MVNIACLVSNGYDILIYSPENDSYLVPECSAESIETAQNNILERLCNEKIFLDFDEVLFETEEDGVCHQILYLCHAFQWTNQIDNDSYRWVEVRNLVNMTISSAYQKISDAINDYFARRESLLAAIKSEIESIYNQSQVKIEIGEQVNTIVFWPRCSKNHVPFCLNVEYYLKKDKSVDFQISWKTSRQYAPGDKSDLYMIFTETMALLLKLFNEPVYVNTYNYFGLESEINGADIIFEGKNYNGTIAEAKFVKKSRIRLFFLTIFSIHMEVYLVQFQMTLSMVKIKLLSNILALNQITSFGKKVVVIIIHT